MAQHILALLGDTHREMIFQVEPESEKRYRAIAEGTEIHMPQARLELGKDVFFSWDISIVGLYAACIPLTEEQASTLMAKDATYRAERKARREREALTAPKVDFSRCMECGNKLTPRGKCAHCGGM